MKRAYIIENKTARAFTLIEVLIVIAILGMMLTATYAPYSHYQKKALLKQGQKEIVQSIYEARNLAINGLDVSWNNVSVGILFDNTSDSSSKKLVYYSYPHDTDNVNLNPTSLPTTSIIKSKDLPNNIQIEKIDWKKQFLFLFDAINGEGRYYAWPWWILNEITIPKVDIDISYRRATTPTLQSDITYYVNTYIADY